METVKLQQLNSPSKKEVHVTDITSGDYFGEIVLFDDENRRDNVVVIVEDIELGREDLLLFLN